MYIKFLSYTVINIMLLYNKNLKQIARKLQTNTTNAKNILWNYIRRRQTYDIQFYRQKIIGNYIVDFFASSINLNGTLFIKEGLTQRSCGRGDLNTTN